MPEAGVRDQITGVIGRFPVVAGMRPVFPENLHVTLLFLGAVAEHECGCLEDEMRHVTIPPFTLRLDRYGYFEGSKSLWLGCSSRPDELGLLVDCLRSSVRRCGVGFDNRPFTPHVTLFRNAQQADFPAAPVAIDWKIKEFHLIESLPHGNTTRYNKTASRQLTGGSGDQAR